VRSQAEIAAETVRVRRTGDRIDTALFVVAGGALVFTCTSVTLFAVRHGTPWFVGWLLDPLASVALFAVLIGDGVLSRHGITAGVWAAVLKLGAGLAWAMNVWSSVAARDPAAVLLHSIAPALLIGLAHAAPAYRIAFASILNQLAVESAHAAQALADHTADRPDGHGDPLATRNRASGRLRSRAVDPPGRPRDRGGRHRPIRPAARSMEELRRELRTAIDTGRIGPRPTAEAIRRLLACAPAWARQLRDELTTSTVPGPAARPVEVETEGSAR
jgi:hypothetical protein